MSEEYLVIYEFPEGARNWGAWVPDLPGCVAVGDSREECERLIATAIALHLEGMREDGDPFPRPTTRAGLVKVAA